MGCISAVQGTTGLPLGRFVPGTALSRRLVSTWAIGRYWCAQRQGTTWWCRASSSPTCGSGVTKYHLADLSCFWKSCWLLALSKLQPCLLAWPIHTSGGCRAGRAAQSQIWPDLLSPRDVYGEFQAVGKWAPNLLSLCLYESAFCWKLNNSKCASCRSRPWGFPVSKGICRQFTQLPLQKRSLWRH